MTCCPPAAHAVAAASDAEPDDDALLALSREVGAFRQLEFAVPDAHCAACIRSIESALDALPQVETARVNLTRRRVRVVFDPERGVPTAIAPAIRAAGYRTFPLDPAEDTSGDTVLSNLVKAMAVAGFAAGNIMLFSVSVWAGAESATRDLFHWISAAIALPAIAYAGRPFFSSAWHALRAGRTNMDVPISIGVLLAAGLSLYETAVSGQHAYFDASTMLLFFLLVGRALDHLMRERARSAITNLARLQPRGATVLRDDGSREHVVLDEIAPGMRLELRAGDRVPVDCTVESEGAVFDEAIVSGESLPRPFPRGATVMAGAGNIGGLVALRAERASTDSFLARMSAMMDAAESARTRPRRIADRASAVYAPVVHLVAGATFLGWSVLGGDWHAALVNAIAVLIITCPCALALAVPMVHIVAAGRLFARGILMKDGAALERAAEVDSVAFDKTGTLTLGQPQLVSVSCTDAEARRLAAALAAASSHPLARALAAALPEAFVQADVTETGGRGVEARVGDGTWRLGSAEWCGLAASGGEATEVWLARDGIPMGRFGFADTLRPDAADTVAALRRLNLPVRLLSGDTDRPVRKVAAATGITDARAGLLPEDKVAAVGAGRTMMVGDGINDAPALRAAYVSAAPATAADIGRSAADFVFTGADLAAVPFLIATASRAAALVRQNLAIAIGYNVIAVPLAITGNVTPLIAAVAMSASSLVVVGNALRLRLDKAPASARPSEAVPQVREAVA